MIERLVHHRFPCGDARPTLTIIPQADLQEFFLPLSAFSVESHAKNGCEGLRSDALVIITCSVSVCLLAFSAPLQIGRKTLNAPCTLESSSRATGCQKRLCGLSSWRRLQTGCCSLELWATSMGLLKSSSWCQLSHSSMSWILCCVRCTCSFCLNTIPSEALLFLRIGMKIR